MVLLFKKKLWRKGKINKQNIPCDYDRQYFSLGAQKKKRIAIVVQFQNKNTSSNVQSCWGAFLQLHDRDRTAGHPKRAYELHAVGVKSYTYKTVLNHVACSY